MTVWICGNSHTGALKLAQDKMGDGNNPLRIFPFGSGGGERREFSAVVDGQVVFTSAKYAAALTKYSGKAFFDKHDRWGLCMGTHSARIYRKKLWSLCEPSAISGPDVRPISQGLLDALIVNDQRHIRAFIQRMKDNDVPCFLVSCPPPRQDHVCFKYGTRRETVGYIHQRSNELFTSWLAERNIDFIDVPPEVQTADGFLEIRFNRMNPPGMKPDRHHANDEYGALMLERIENYLNSVGSS